MKRDATRAWAWILAIILGILMAKIIPVLLFPGPIHP